MIIRGFPAASPRAAAAPLVVAESRRRTAPGGAGGAAAGPWTSVLIRVAAARARGATSTCWQQWLSLQRCFLTACFDGYSIYSSRASLRCDSTPIAIYAIVAGHLTKLLHCPVAAAAAKVVWQPSRNGSGEFKAKRNSRTTHQVRPEPARSPVPLFCQCAAWRRRRERCRVEALTQGDARIVKRTTAPRTTGQLFVSLSPCCPT